MDINDIKENYKKFDDWEIEKIASEEAASLRPEVIDILKSEIEKRNLNLNLLDSVNSQIKELTESEFNQYSNILRNHPCPSCKSRTNRINATMVGRVISMLILTNYEKNLKIAVVLGGVSSEKDISILTGLSVAEALSGKYDTEVIHIGSDISILPEKLLGSNIVFNALHGGIGENGDIQSFLDLHHISYCGSAAKASKLAMDKHLSKMIAKTESVLTPEWILIKSDNYSTQLLNENAIKLIFTDNKINSIDINIIITFFLLRKIPSTPIVKRIAPKKRK